MIIKFLLILLIIYLRKVDFLVLVLFVRKNVWLVFFINLKVILNLGLLSLSFIFFYFFFKYLV